MGTSIIMALATSTVSSSDTISPLGARCAISSFYIPSACTTELPFPPGKTKIFWAIFFPSSEWPGSLKTPVLKSVC